MWEVPVYAPSLRALLLKDLLEGGQPVKASTYETADSVAPLVCLLGMNQDTDAYNLSR